MENIKYRDIQGNENDTEKWFMAKLDEDTNCYVNNGILTIWKEPLEGSNRIISKSRMDDVADKMIKEAIYHFVSKESVDQEVAMYHRYKNNFFDRMIEPITLKGPRGGMTTSYRSKKTGIKKHRFNILLTDELYKKIVEQSLLKGLTRNEFIIETLSNGV